MYWIAGLGHLSGDDIADSKKFLQKVYKRQLTEAEAGKRKLIVAGELDVSAALVRCIGLALRAWVCYLCAAAPFDIPPLQLGPAELLTLTQLWQISDSVVHADCGAGVGRVTEQLLLHHFAIVDLIEPSKHLMGTAEQNLSTSGHGVYPEGHKSGQYFNMGLQAWTPEAGRY